MSTEDVASAREVAQRWLTAAERQLRSGQWQLSAREAEIAFDVAGAGGRPSASVPPHTDEELWLRLSRLTGWAAAIRLGLRALGRVVPDSDGSEGAAREPTGVITLPGLLWAMYACVIKAQQWQQRHNSLGFSAQAAEIDKALAEEVPGLVEHVAGMETLLGPFGLSAVLWAAATGETED